MPRCFPHENAFHLVTAEHELLNAAGPAQLDDSATLEIHEIFIHPFFQPVKILLPDSPALQLIITLYSGLIH